MFLFLMRFAFAGACLHAAPVATWISGEADLLKEYCKTATPLEPDTCSIPEDRDAAVLPFPLELGHIVEGHVRQAATAGYYQTLSMSDFYHGHLIMKGPQNTFADEDDFFANIGLILYHTAEFTDRWEQQVAAGQTPTPRSLLGFLDGGLRLAIDLVTPLGFAYERAGTIYSADVVRSMPQLTSLDYLNGGGVPDVFVFAAGQRCQVDSLEFYIQPAALGRFTTPDGAPMEIFIRCVKAVDDSQIRYKDLPRRDGRALFTLS